MSSPEDVTAVRAHFSRGVIGSVTDELYGKTGLYCASTDTNSQKRLFSSDFNSSLVQKIAEDRNILSGPARQPLIYA
ncbi:hypothetical protein TNCV_4095241 [Trichonephila clavipes]|uniref:Uncharacterized protein n=1 Tax=Trichonephila clavipes TaxID=2585209 RepID=A0A8X6VCL6_TRICX|nr:hypothetical protein TNCV_4095241 [Trichonephila clavipes]